MRIWTEQMGISPCLLPRLPLPFVPFLTLDEPARQDGATTASLRMPPCGMMNRPSQSLCRLRCATFSGDAGETASLVFLHRLRAVTRTPLHHTVSPPKGKARIKLCAGLASWLRTETGQPPECALHQSMPDQVNRKRKNCNISHRQLTLASRQGDGVASSTPTAISENSQTVSVASTRLPSAGSGVSVLARKLELIGPRILLASRFHPVVSVQFFSRPLSNSQQSCQETDPCCTRKLCSGQAAICPGLYCFCLSRKHSQEPGWQETRCSFSEKTKVGETDTSGKPLEKQRGLLSLLRRHKSDCIPLKTGSQTDTTASW